DGDPILLVPPAQRTLCLTTYREFRERRTAGTELVSGRGGPDTDDERQRRQEAQGNDNHGTLPKRTNSLRLSSTCGALPGPTAVSRPVNSLTRTSIPVAASTPLATP